MESKKIKLPKLEQFKENVEHLESLFNDRISEMHNVKGAQAERQAFCYYRSLLWDIKREILGSI